MKKPILVNELPVDDAKALELGQYRASDFVSGGKELPRTSVVINRLGDKMQSVANIMLSQGSLPDDAKMSDLLSQNASKVLDYLVKEGVVSATEEQTLRKDATAMRQWMEELLKTGLFEGDKQTEAAFNQLPDNARRAVLATYLRDAKSADEAKIKRNLQRSFEAYNEMMNNPAFVNAKNVADARAAVAAEIERGNNSLLGEEPIRERFSNFELELAALYKGLKDQKTLTGLLNRYFDAVQGDKVSNRQLEIGEEPREAISKKDALKEVFGLQESKPAETQNQVDKAVKNIATEITKKTGIEVVTDEKEAEEALRNADDNIKEQRVSAGGAIVDWGNTPTKAKINNDELTSIIMRNNRSYIEELDKLPDGETLEHYIEANGYMYVFRVDKDHNIYIEEALPMTSSVNRERINELKEYYDGERARRSETVYSDRGENQSELGRPEDTNGDASRGGNIQDSEFGGRHEGTDKAENVERDSSRSKTSGVKISVLQRARCTALPTERRFFSTQRR